MNNLVDNIFKDYILEEDDYKNIIDILITGLFNIFVFKFNMSDEDSINEIKKYLNYYLDTLNKEV